jgi:transposase
VDLTMSVLESLEQSGEILSPAVRAALVLLEAQLSSAQERIQLLETQVQELTRENTRLREHVRDLEPRLGMNSSNSSKPPSSDPPRAKRRASGRRGMRRAREGHRGAGRDLLPEERIDEIIEYRAEQCRRCGLSLAQAPVVGAPGRWQGIELPPVRAHVMEHRTLCCACPGCGTRTAGRAAQAGEAEPLWPSAGGLRHDAHEPLPPLAAPA